MILAEATYPTKQGRKCSVILILGRDKNKIICLLNHKMAINEIKIIKKFIKSISKMKLPDKIKWIKENAPISYKNGFRKFLSQDIKIKESYSLISGKFI